ncbi:TIGR02300 family protein [Candidatus Endowatersipora endosymbiont of Watersipora subatra]|uniref:TIGR02300 family protein n=1 Tax=Candidatus Endowatersipora endosymbiont of Watersipora subatra TaxID=3077946 RepID=UPI00312CB1CA
MAKAELGRKCLCSSCAAKYYDLNRNPIICPKCGAEVVIDETAKTKIEKKMETQRSMDDDHLEGSRNESISLEEDNSGDISDVDIEDDDTGESSFLEDDEMSSIIPVHGNEKEDT